jgi:serpin B
MMTAAGDFAYDRGANLEMIDLPYHGNRFRMEIALPASGVSLQSLARRLSPGLWSGWRRRARPLYGSVSLPRFTFSNDFNLTGPLTQLGMGSAFSDGADFSGMCVQPCRLSQARHKTFLSVNEQGTTAAAVTSIGVSPTAARQPAFTMVVDRPFLVAIDDSLTGSILFLGAVNRPG